MMRAGLGVFAAGAVLTASIGAASAHGMGREKVFNPEKKAAIEQALEQADYQAWKTATSDLPGKLTENVTPENFAQFAKAHQLMKEGKHAEAKQIMKDLGFLPPPRGGHKEGKVSERKKGFSRHAGAPTPTAVTK